jgi:hypothetical protein
VKIVATTMEAAALTNVMSGLVKAGASLTNKLFLQCLAEQI